MSPSPPSPATPAPPTAPKRILVVRYSQTGQLNTVAEQMLAPLRGDGVLVLASGNTVHNLGDISWEDGAPVPDWAREFDGVVAGALREGRKDALLGWESLTARARRVHPTPDHFWPLLYVAALRRPGEPLSFPVEGFQNGTIAMRASDKGGQLGAPPWIPKSAIAAYLTFFPVTINVLRGLESFDRDALALMRSYAATPMQIFTKLRLPNSTPYLFTALKIASTASVIGAIIGELPTGSKHGIGVQIINGAQTNTFNPGFLWATIVMASILGLLFYGAVALAEKRIVRWK